MAKLIDVETAPVSETLYVSTVEFPFVLNSTNRALNKIHQNIKPLEFACPVHSEWECPVCTSQGMKWSMRCKFCGTRTEWNPKDRKRIVTIFQTYMSGRFCFLLPGDISLSDEDIRFLQYSPNYIVRWAM